MDARSERYALDVASAMAALPGPRLAGAYLHGSAVLGGFDARRSDVDVLAAAMAR
jgi:predicted nucleotidyltransferase